MKISIQTKLLTLSIFLVILAILTTSIAYYVLARQDKHRESRQRIQIAFDIIRDDFAEQFQAHSKQIEEFLQRDQSLTLATQVYTRQTTEQMGLTQAIVSQLVRVGSITSANRLKIYSAEKKLLVTYFPSETQMQGKAEWTPPEQPVLLPGEIPASITPSFFAQDGQVGLRITAPLLQENEIVGVLSGDFTLTETMIARYAALSKTEINFFAGTALSVGTLSVQRILETPATISMSACDELAEKPLEIFTVMFAGHGYYQGQCAFQDGQTSIGAISVSLSQDIERQAIRSMIGTILLIVGIVTTVAIGLSVLLSRSTFRSIRHIVRTIAAVSDGDLRSSAQEIAHDEIGEIGHQLNRMIAQLRNMSGQIQQTSGTVKVSAHTIVHSMATLIEHLQEQSGSVEHMSSSVEGIKQFIDDVVRNTATLLSAAAEILSAIQETQASTQEVNTSVTSLTTNLHLISASVSQVERAVQQILEHTERLETGARQTDVEVQQIDHALHEVSQNAEQTRTLAQDTMHAATRGKISVEAAIQGMMELKDVVTRTAQIIGDVKGWGEQVSSILDMVDEITEQTSLLALNASIISAQAGAHGRGFMVVAEEIKELATRTKASTHEIGSLIRELHQKTADGVQHTEEGLRKADQGVQLAHAVQEALHTILESATRSSNRAADTVNVVQLVVERSQSISSQTNQVTDMASNIRIAVQQEEQDLDQVAGAVENLSGMAEQVNRAMTEQSRAAQEIERSMVNVTDEFSAISDQTETLQHDTEQIVAAMRTINATTEWILAHATEISGETVNTLVSQAETLNEMVKVFKIS